MEPVGDSTSAPLTALTCEARFRLAAFSLIILVAFVARSPRSPSSAASTSWIDSGRAFIQIYLNRSLFSSPGNIPRI